MNPLAPLFGLGSALYSGYEIYEAANNFLNKNPNSPTSPPDSPYNPKKKRTPEKSTRSAAQRDKLSGAGEGVVVGLAAGAALIGQAINDSHGNGASHSEAKKAENDAMKEPFASAPLLKNQIELKGSIDELITALYTQSVVSSHLFGTLDGNLSAISSTLLTISSTLIDISENYKDQLENTGDLPYIDSKTFYDMLERNGASKDDVFNWKNGEDEIVRSIGQTVSFPELKQAILAYRNATIPQQYILGVGFEASGVTAPSPLNPDGSVSPTQSSIDLTKLNDWADTAKENLEFQKNPLLAPDTSTQTGTLELSPREASHAKNLHTARGQADENTIGGGLISVFDELIDSIDPSNFSLPSYSSISDMLIAIGVDDLDAYTNDLKTKYGAVQ